MGVQNFLEEEDYSDDYTPPDSERELDGEEGEELDWSDQQDLSEEEAGSYGGGFFDGVENSRAQRQKQLAQDDGFVPNFLDEEEDYGDLDYLEDEGEYEEDGEAYSGENLLEDHGEEEYSPYSISVGSAPRAAEAARIYGDDEDDFYAPEALSEPTVVESDGRPDLSTSLPTASRESSTGHTTGSDSKVDTTNTTTTPPADSSSSTDSAPSVPNFLLDEEEEDSYGLEQREVDSASAVGSRSDGDSRGSGSDGIVRATEAISTEASPRRRRDLSNPTGANSTGSGGTTLREKNSTTAESGSSGSEKSSPGVGEVAVDRSPTVVESFVAGGVEPPSKDESSVFRSPSERALTRDPKYTALLQKDSTVRKVGEDGLTEAERARRERRNSSSKRTPSNGKLSEGELLFYANLGASKLSDYAGASKKSLILPPTIAESQEQKKERERRINRALGSSTMARGSRTRLTPKDYRVLEFIALFKFVSERQIAKLLKVTENTAYRRLNGLRKYGFLKSFQTLGIRGSVWVLTETGMDLSGYELPRGSEGALTLSMVSHQFTVNHVAAHLWSSGANVLREKQWPVKNLTDSRGEPDYGDRIVSELQIQSSFAKVRGRNKAEAYVPQIKRHMANQFDSWERAGGVNFGPSPEFQTGNEYMWTLFPPVSSKLNYHVPDLVVARPRAADGSPQSIAVEVELRTKSNEQSYERTLEAYRTDTNIFKKVVWVCRLKGTAEKLSRIAKRNGLAKEGRIAIVPIYLEDNSRFTGKDTWSL